MPKNPLASLLAMPPEEKESRGITHTLHEIAQQPGTWLATYRRFRELHSEILAFLQSTGIGSREEKPTVFMIGAGTSDYIGRSLAPLLRRCWQCETFAVPSTDLLTDSEQWLIPGRKYFWISFSRSGESPEGIAVVQQALQKHPSVRHLLVSCNAQGKMLHLRDGHKQAFAVSLPPEVNDRGLAMTSSFSNMVVYGQCMAHATSIDSYAKTLQSLADAGHDFIERAAAYASELAGAGCTKICFLGSGALKAVATESALKVLELTAGKIQTMSESALGLRHGPMASLDGQTLLVAFLSGDEKIRAYELDLLEEIRRKNLVKARAVVMRAAAERLDNIADYVLPLSLPAIISDDYRPPVDVIFGQLLGLFFSLRCGLKPDSPSPNGAISRVVQTFRIHS